MFYHGFPRNWSTLKKLIWLRGSPAGGALGFLKTVTGAIIHITDGLARPAQSLTVDFSPIQDLHGYENPWPAGGGKNLCDPSGIIVGFYDNEGNYAPSPDYATSDLIPVEANTRYTGTFFTANKSFIAYLVYTEWDASKNFIRQSTEGSNFVTSANTAYVRVRNYNAQTPYVTSNDFLYMFEKGPYSSSFAPYSNICPISGWTGVDIYDDPAYGGTIRWNQLVQNGNFESTDGWYAGNGSASASDNKLTFTATSKSTYQYVNRNCSLPKDHKILMMVTVTLSQNESVGFGDGATIPKTYSVTANQRTELAYIHTPSADRSTFYIYPARTAGLDVGGTAVLENAMLFDLTEMFGAGNEPATVEAFRELFPHDYYAYDASYTETTVSAVNGDPYWKVSVTWQDEAGTVYGGYVRFNEDGSVDLIGEKAKYVATGSSTMSGGSFAEGTDTCRVFIPGQAISPSMRPNATNVKAIMADNLSPFNPDYIYSNDVEGVSENKNATTNGLWIRISKTRLSEYTQDGVKAYLDDNPLSVVYPLATPVTYQLTPTEVQILLGENNLWSTGDTIELQYYGSTPPTP